MTGIWAVVPVKEAGGAKQRLAGALSPEQRRDLARVMLEDVLAALAAASGLAGIVLVTRDPVASAMAVRYGARVLAEGARDGHTGAVTAAARRLAAEGAGGLLTLPGDVPLVTPGEIAALLAAHGPAPAFTIAPAHDELGSNAILCSPPDAVPFRFGEDSFRPHLAAARACGIEPLAVALPGIGMDIDHPEDLMRFLGCAGDSRTRRWLEEGQGFALDPPKGGALWKPLALRG